MTWPNNKASERFFIDNVLFNSTAHCFSQVVAQFRTAIWSILCSWVTGSTMSEMVSKLNPKRPNIPSLTAQRPHHSQNLKLTNVQSDSKGQIIYIWFLLDELLSCRQSGNTVYNVTDLRNKILKFKLISQEVGEFRNLKFQWKNSEMSSVNWWFLIQRGWRKLQMS